MSSSGESICMTNVRVTGIDGTPGQGAPETGVVAGVKYFRKFQKNGVVRPAHVELVLTRNHMRYGNDGTAINSSDTMRLEAWNADNDDGSGRGVADHIAKWYSVGKSFSIVNARLRVYKRQVYLSNGAIVNNIDGTPVLVPATSLVIRSMSQLTPGNESRKTEAREVANYLSGMTQKSFFSRPPNWSVPGHPDNVIWREIITWRKAQKFDGKNYYGNAKVCMVSGATPADGYSLNTEPVGGVAAPQPQVQTPNDLNKLLMSMLTPEQQANIFAMTAQTQAPATQTQPPPQMPQVPPQMPQAPFVQAPANTVGTEVPF